MSYFYDKSGAIDVGDTYFMSYHTPLKKSSDWYKALVASRAVAQNITIMLNQAHFTDKEIKVFPYRYIILLRFFFLHRAPR